MKKVVDEVALLDFSGFIRASFEETQIKMKYLMAKTSIF